MTTSLQFATILRAGLSFAVVIAAYCAYSVCAVPLIEPTATERPPPDKPPPTTQHGANRHTKLLAELYPDPSAWQRNNPKIVETDQAVLLLMDYTTLADGRMELKPCSLLLLPKRHAKAGQDQVVVLDAPDGAVLQFDKQLDLRKAEFGRLVGGRLAGEVTIRSHGGTPEEQLLLTTRNVNMDQQRIWTPHEVYFRYGRNAGEGRDLIITLLPGAETTGPQRGPNIGGIKSLELVHLERLHLVGKASMFPTKKAESRSSLREEQHFAKRNATMAGTPVEVTCEGPFLVDFQDSVATFEDRVNVLRLNPDGPSDQLNCRLLEIHFAKGLLQTSGTDAKRQKGVSDEAAGDAVRKIVALGHPVVLQSPSWGAQARGDRLEYDLAQRQFQLDGQQPVMLEFGDRRIEAPAVQYRLPAQGRIGQAWARGPGRFTARLEGDPVRHLSATWKGELTLQPDGEQHVLSLKGGANVRELSFGGLSAEQIHLWLLEQRSSPTATDPQQPTILPDRLLAENNVQLTSAALTGATERFEVWFHHIPQVAAGDRQPRPRGSNLAGAALADQAAQPGSRYHLSGKLLRILLAVAGREVQLRDVSVEGDARIKETHTAQPATAPLMIAGNVIHVTAADSQQAKAVVVGQPAHISGRGVTVEGASVHVDRAANLAWVPGAGKAILPLGGTDFQVGADGRRNSRTGLETRPANSAQEESATITWRDGMQFDGRTVQLRGEVLASTQTKRLAAPAVDVSITRHIDFANPPARDGINVADVQFHGQVNAESRTFEAGELTAIDTMLVRQLRIDNQTGKLTADGPGWMKSVRRGQNEFQPAASGGADHRALRSSNRDGLTYVRITFESSVTGNVHERYAQLHDDVHAVYGPVQRWDEMIDVDDALASRDDVIVLSSDMLQVAQMGEQATGGAAVEMQALGNAMVEGAAFTARAHRIAYSQAKDMLLMEGDGRNHAELYHQKQAGGQSGRAAARKIVYWPGTGRMDVDTFHSFDGLTPLSPSGGILPESVGRRLREERQNRIQPPTSPPR